MSASRTASIAAATALRPRQIAVGQRWMCFAALTLLMRARQSSPAKSALRMRRLATTAGGSLAMRLQPVCALGGNRAIGQPRQPFAGG